MTDDPDGRRLERRHALQGGERRRPDGSPSSASACASCSRSSSSSRAAGPSTRSIPIARASTPPSPAGSRRSRPADDRVAQVGTTVQEVADAATAVATSEAVWRRPSRRPLSTRLSGISERYTPIRAAYADARSDLVSALDRVQTSSVRARVSVPQGADRRPGAGRPGHPGCRTSGSPAILTANSAGTAIRATGPSRWPMPHPRSRPPSTTCRPGRFSDARRA